MSTISRRHLAAGTAVLLAGQKNLKANKPLPDRPDLDPVAWTLQQYDQAPLKMTYKPGNQKATIAWQHEFRTKLGELVGAFPKQRVPLQPEVFETREFATFRRERIVFQSRPGSAVSAYLLLPKNPAITPTPVMICVPGHGRGADDLVGVDDKGNDRNDKGGYQHDFAIQCVENGFAALAIEPMAFGCRRDHKTKSKGAGVAACQPTAGAALLLGQTMIGWRGYDISRAIDYIETRPEINSRRIGCMGISGGGTATLFTTALESRITLAYVSGYLNTFRDSIVAISHCIDNYVPGVLNFGEMYDVAGLIAPRPLYVESGKDDPIFPVEAARKSVELTRRVYTAMSAETKLEHRVFDDGHVFWGKQGWDFVKANL
jgi:dienelactone hydrolase